MLPAAISLATVGTIVTALIGGLRRRVAVRPLDARGHAARRDPGGHRQRRDLRGAARLDAAAEARPHARGRGGPERPGRGAARDRVHRLDPGPGLRPRRHGALAGGRARRSARRSAAASAGSRCTGCRRTRLASAGLYPVASIAIAALAFGLADVAHGSGFLAVYLDRARARQRPDPRQAHDHHLPRRARLARPGRDVPDARPARVPVRSWPTSRSRARRLAS